eukprot:TRINITY_DN45902_c0_g1_i1.p1 TRINITY_DN45902_c0_g1~~TRINITY_DN45902_c0_g1_i1.p1  ORF type:complete len:473 (+),score=64.55 TRINITY_DN45902_c0_g1_i1:104-1522(+)
MAKSATRTTEFAVGHRVQVIGLSSRPELNGCEGVLVRYVSERSRWEVWLDGASADSKPLGLREDNLKGIGFSEPPHLDLGSRPDATRKDEFQEHGVATCDVCTFAINDADISEGIDSGCMIHASCARALRRLGARDASAQCRSPNSAGATDDEVSHLVDEAALMNFRAARLRFTTGKEEAQRVASLAAALLREALKLNPNHSAAHRGLAFALAMHEDFDGELAEMKAAAGTDPYDAFSQAALARALLQRGEVDKALTTCTGFLKTNAQSADVYIAYGCALKQKCLDMHCTGTEGSESALMAFQLAVDCDELNAEAHACLGDMLLWRGDNDAAIESCSKAVSLDPRSAEFYCRLSIAMRAKADSEGELAALRTAVRVEPKHPVARRSLGLCLGKRGELENAITQLNIAVNENPQDLDARCYLAAILKSKDDFRGSYAAYSDILRLSPNHPVALRESKHLLETSADVAASTNAS